MPINKYKLFEDQICPLNTLSIVIPTVKYTNYLDEAINSCFNIKDIDLKIFVNINSEKNFFLKSKFWDDKRVTWNRTSKYFPLMLDSINSAVKNSEGEWLFILSDDDIIKKDFLQNVDRNSFTQKTLYATRIDIIDSSNNVLRTNNKYKKYKYLPKEMLDIYFNNKLQNHLSLFVFHRALFEKVNGFVQTGYPNGYFIDTVFHGKIIANSNLIYASRKVVFSRRETESQESAKFYYDNNINKYFDLITNNLFEDVEFKSQALERFSTRNDYKSKLLEYRYFTELSKLTNIIFNKSFLKLFNFQITFLRCWNVTYIFKMKSLFYFSKFLISFLKRRKL